MSKTNLYQFKPGHYYPFVLEVEEGLIGDDKKSILTELHFTQVDAPQALQKAHKNIAITTLKLGHMKPKVLRSMNALASHGSDWFAGDSEVMSRTHTHSVYTCFRESFIMWSELVKEWQGALIQNYSVQCLKLSIIRALSWASVDWSMIGVWAIPAQDAVAVFRPKESDYECVFFDLVLEQKVTFSKVSDLHYPQVFYRPDSSINSSKRYSSEEAMSILMMRSTYYPGPHGYPAKVRELFQEICLLSHTEAISQDKLQKPDLSL